MEINGKLVILSALETVGDEKAVRREMRLLDKKLRVVFLGVFPKTPLCIKKLQQDNNLVSIAVFNNALIDEQVRDRMDAHDLVVRPRFVISTTSHLRHALCYSSCSNDNVIVAPETVDGFLAVMVAVNIRLNVKECTEALEEIFANVSFEQRVHDLQHFVAEALEEQSSQNQS